MLFFKLSNNIQIQPLLRKLNSDIENETEIEFVVESYESLKYEFHKGSRFKKLLLPFFFFFRRFIPNFPLLNKIDYFRNKRVLGLGEIMGRICFAGFSINSYELIKNEYSIKCKRISDFSKTKYRNEGIVIKLDRLGKNGKIFSLYKFRTMHPYSEFIQNLILKNNGFSNSGKIQNDFRLTRYGKILRKYYLDELPQLANFVLGDLKLVGIRAVSKVYMDKLPDDLKKLRFSHKPGCIPPYVSEGLKPSFQNACEAEMRYLLRYNKKPLFTDLTYFIKGVYNIFFKSVRSQ
jgi:lipopolysaccharide/colanic/teichoic acid biosynthesis glycosyltransferase